MFGDEKKPILFKIFIFKRCMNYSFNQNNINYKSNRRTRTAKQVIPPQIVTCTIVYYSVLLCTIVCVYMCSSNKCLRNIASCFMAKLHCPRSLDNYVTKFLQDAEHQPGLVIFVP